MSPALLEFIARHRRRYPSGEDPTSMPTPPPTVSDADARESMKRLIDLVQVLLPERPSAVLALERAVLALVVDEMRQRIIERLQHMSPEDISTVEALTAHLARHPGEPPPRDEPA